MHITILGRAYDILNSLPLKNGGRELIGGLMTPLDGSIMFEIVVDNERAYARLSSASNDFVVSMEGIKKSELSYEPNSHYVSLTLSSELHAISLGLAPTQSKDYGQEKILKKEFTKIHQFIKEKNKPHQ